MEQYPFSPFMASTGTTFPLLQSFGNVWTYSDECRVTSVSSPFRIRLERHFMRLQSIVWFWPPYHHVTNSRQVSDATGSLVNYRISSYV